MNFDEVWSEIGLLKDDQEYSFSRSTRVLDNLVALFKDAKNSIEQNPNNEALAEQNINELMKAVDAVVDQKQLSEPQEKVIRRVNRCEKKLQAIIKGSKAEEEWNSDSFSEKKDILNLAIAECLVRDGLFEIAEIFSKEANISLPNNLKDKFVELKEIISATYNMDLDPAMNWIKRKGKELERIESNLEFQIYCWKYTQLLANPSNNRNPSGKSWKSSSLSALEFAKKHLTKFSATHLSELQKLFCCLIYTFDIKSSPYSALMDPKIEFKNRELFSREFYRLSGYTPESPLHVISNVGTISLPTILKMESIVKASSNLQVLRNEKLTVEIPLLSSQRYHSFFSCPISKEPSDESNPPIMLNCGHVICKACVGCLSKNNIHWTFKCPYCTIESTNSDILRLYI